MSVPKLYHFPNETNEFIFPDHASPELINYIADMKLPNDDDVLQVAMNNIPNVDINALLPMMEEKSVDQAKIQLAIVRHVNRICDHCGYKTDVRQLSLCTDCCLVWYCNETCMLAHAPKHTERCRDLHGPLDDGYQALSFIKIDK